MSSARRTPFSLLEVFQFPANPSIGELIPPRLIAYLHCVVLIASVWGLLSKLEEGLFTLGPPRYLHISENSSCVLPLLVDPLLLFLPDLMT